jgi:hypothetical protein
MLAPRISLAHRLPQYLEAHPEASAEWFPPYREVYLPRPAQQCGAHSHPASDNARALAHRGWVVLAKDHLEGAE